jgi:hypothetical protein
MAASEAIYSSLDACKGTPILMGDNSSINLLSMYQMMNSSIGKKFLFTTNSMDIYDMQTNSKVATGEVNHQSRLYTFSEFIETNSALLLTNADESSRIWHERFGHLNFIYIQ